VYVAHSGLFAVFSEVEVGILKLDVSAAVVLAVLTVVLVFGVQQSARLNIILVGCTVSVMLLVTVSGFIYADITNWQPFLPFGVQGAFSGASIVFFSFIGFDAVTTLAEEMQHPQKVHTALLSLHCIEVMHRRTYL
jgi:amino acid transporter